MTSRHRTLGWLARGWLGPGLRRGDGSVGLSAGSGVDVLEQVAPVGIRFADQAQFPLAVPVLHPLFADDGFVDILVALDGDQPDQAILAAELRRAPRGVA